MRKFHRNRQAIYPASPWEVAETSFDPQFNHGNEAIFSVGNGYLGLRGTLEEGVPEHIPSTPGIYLNGIYETEPIIYGEFMAAQPAEYQSMINITNWLGIQIHLDGEVFSMFSGEVEDYKRSLDLKKGTLKRTLTWTSPQGKKAHFSFERFASHVDPHLALQRCEVTPLNFSGTIKINSIVDGDVHNHHHLREQALEVLSIDLKNESGYIISKTKNSKITIACGVTHKTPPHSVLTGMITDTSFELSAEFEAKAQEKYCLEKHVALTTSRDTELKKLLPFVQSKSSASAERGFDKSKKQQVNYLEKYWEHTDVVVKGDPAMQQGLRYNALQLLQATGKDGKTSIAAKGLSGEYYEGHYFWDTEIYIIPFFLYSQPDVVKSLLTYRYSILDEARQNAKRMGDQGALYAWRTINGQEGSGNFLGSTVQYHINAAIAYAINKYYEATDDEDFLVSMGAEMIFETARCWASRGVFLPTRGGKYCINEVCGPDEYKPGVNNNCYTNYMAKFNLKLAIRVGDHLAKKHPEAYAELKEKLGLKEAEFALWQKCADLMYLPFDKTLGIHPQDDSFLEKDPLDIDAIPHDQLPLVANWHPLRIWRYQLIKQADVILLMLLLGDKFSLDEKRANFDYYEPKTTHDSSLSPAIYSIIAAELGYEDFAYNYFLQTVRLDLDDYNRNTWQGLHTACMASSWLGVVQGFAGMRTYDGQLHFRPYLPEQWQEYSFKFKFKNAQIKVMVNSMGTLYTLLKGEEISFFHHDYPVTLTGKKSELLIDR